MDKVLRHLHSISVEVYVDDIVVKSPNLTQHSQDLAEVFTVLKAYNMCLNPKKCVFGVDGDKLLGFILTRRRIEANLEK